jgi:dTDP-4-amino-4,6-dideoxygalactose transaminase
MNIPFVDLALQYQNHKDEIDTAIQSVINDCAFIGTVNNKYVQAFENEFANYIGTDHCIACANGTDSLEIILKAFGIGPGDEVIVPALSWISTSEAVSNVGAKPVFVDIEPEYYSINPECIEEKITPLTKAIIPVHLYGHPAQMDKIMEIAIKSGLKVIEDCAQAHGAEINNQKVGTIGHAGSFSFFPGKNLGAYGDAGGIVTNDRELADRCRMIGQHGQLRKKHVHFIEGRNSRMDGIQAAVLSVKLKYLPGWTDLRIKHANEYNNMLNDIVKTPAERSGCKHVFHLFVIETENRDQFSKQLNARNVPTAVQYPTPLPLLDAYKKWGYKQSDFPVAAEVCNKIISLPIYPEMTKSQLEYVCHIIKYNEVPEK